MIERRPFEDLPNEDLGWLKARRHFASTKQGELSRTGWGCIRAWNDEELMPDTGFTPQTHADTEIITYVHEGVLTHRDNLGNERRMRAGDIQVVCAGAGIRHAEYNLDHTPARIFRIWIASASKGGAPAWALLPNSIANRAGCLVPIASGYESDHEAVPIRACARVLSARLEAGESVTYALCELRLAYLVPSFGIVDINGVRIYARDGAAIRDVETITIAAIEKTDVVMVDVFSDAALVNNPKS